MKRWLTVRQAITEAKKAAKQERIRKELLALPPMTRIKLRVSAGVFEVSLVRVVEETSSVEVIWDRGMKREFKWGSVVFGNTETIAGQKPTEIASYLPPPQRTLFCYHIVHTLTMRFRLHPCCACSPACRDSAVRRTDSWTFNHQQQQHSTSTVRSSTCISTTSSPVPSAESAVPAHVSTALDIHIVLPTSFRTTTTGYDYILQHVTALDVVPVPTLPVAWRKFVCSYNTTHSIQSSTRQ